LELGTTVSMFQSQHCVLTTEETVNICRISWPKKHGATRQHNRMAYRSVSTDVVHYHYTTPRDKIMM